jgi:F-type H+-transporting ATPase subunit gamma
VVLIAPEKGLCGGLITNIYKKFAQIKDTSVEGYRFITVGKRAKKIVNKLGGDIVADFEIGYSKPSYDLVPTIAKLIKEKFLASEVQKVSVFYSEFVNVMTQVPIQKTLLPLQFDETSEIAKTKNDYLFEPTTTAVVEFLLDRYLEVEIYQFLLEAYASEQSARMVAMKNATDNAETLITDLSISYNKARQASITNELTDISSANLMV